MNKFNLIAVVLAVLILSVSGWASCRTVNAGTIVKTMLIGQSDCTSFCGHGTEGGCATKSTPSSGYYFVSMSEGNQRCTHYGSPSDAANCPSNCKGGVYGLCGKITVDCYRTECTDQCEADSIVCLQNGGTWTNTGASTCDGKSCKFSNCLQSDTLWLNDSKAACDAIGGENNYAITDIDETCVHSGICCPSDSALVGNTCKWRCDSIYTACTAKNGYLYAAVLQDTTISGEDSIFTNKCYYNCSYAYNKDSTTSVTDGNTACSSPSTPIADCTRMPNDFSSVRTTYGDSVYSYDFLTPGSAAYIDSIVLTPCSRFMYRCTVNGKYKYWYSDADIPTGCTNIVKIK